jgi:hypothetical protein
MTAAQNRTLSLAPAAACIGVSLSANINGSAIRVDVPLVLTGTTAVSVGRGSISEVTVRSAAGMAGTVYVAGAGNDYVVDATAGTIARDGSSTIPSGATVFVTYRYALTDADFNAIGGGRVFSTSGGPNNTVLRDQGKVAYQPIETIVQLATTQYVTGDGASNAAESTYAAGDTLFAGAGTGRLTNSTSGTPPRLFIVIQPPSANDEFLIAAAV